MPVIARFYGIIIKMYFSQSEHGDLPPRADKLVKEWASLYQSELLRMWQTNEFKQLPGLE